MKDTIIQQMTMVITALGSIRVSGKQDCANMSGCIGLLEDIMNAISKYEAEADIETAE